MRWERPPSALRLAAEANAFSISSIQRMTGDIASVWQRALRRLASDSPMKLAYRVPGSSRSSG